MPAWFDLRPLDQPKDELGIASASEAISSIIQSEIDSGLPSKRIILGGFSQGGAIALYSALTTPFKLGGILALSTWLPLTKSIPWENIQQKRQKILQLHGDEDDMVSIQRAEKTAAVLKTHLGDAYYTFKAYRGLGHTVASEEELDDIKKFFEDVLPPLPDSKL